MTVPKIMRGWLVDKATIFFIHLDGALHVNPRFRRFCDDSLFIAIITESGLSPKSSY